MAQLLKDQINVQGVMTISKEEILRGLESENPNEKANFFIFALTEVLNFTENEKIKAFLKEYKKGDITIIPSIKAMFILSYFPETLIDFIKLKSV